MYFYSVNFKFQESHIAYSKLISCRSM